MQLTEKYDIPYEWIFTYFCGKNWNRCELEQELKQNGIIIPD